MSGAVSAASCVVIQYGQSSPFVRSHSIVTFGNMAVNSSAISCAALFASGSSVFSDGIRVFRSTRSV